MRATIRIADAAEVGKVIRLEAENGELLREWALPKPTRRSAGIWDYKKMLAVRKGVERYCRENGIELY